MSRRRRLGVLACVLLVALAGCGAQEVSRPGTAGSATTPTATTNDAGTGTDAVDAGISYRGGSLPVAAGPVFDRVESLLGVTARSPDRVAVENATTWFGPNDSRRRTPTGTARFGALVGVDPTGQLGALRATPNGATSPFGGVSVYPGEGSPAELEVVLAHEFAHVVQFQRNQVSTVRRNTGGTSTDARWTARSVVEGVAVWTETRYVETYGVDAPTGGERVTRLYEQAEPGTPFRHGQAAYVFGYEYVRNHSADLRSVDQLYERPPTTSEQVLHGLAPGSEPPAVLYVRTIAGAGWRGTASDTLGEAYARVVLENGVPVSRAASAAAGWGNDRLVTYRDRPTANASFVWVTRWDTPADAAAFRDAMNATFDATGTRSGDRWRLAGHDARATTLRPNATTVVVPVGDPGLLDALSVSLDRATVVLTTNRSTSANAAATTDDAATAATPTIAPVTAESGPGSPFAPGAPRRRSAQSSLAPQTTTPGRS